MNLILTAFRPFQFPRSYYTSNGINLLYTTLDLHFHADLKIMEIFYH